MQTQHLDFAETNERAGFRLRRIELYNWGTFHNKVWRLLPQGDNALLTGDIGSGKSTLVDAITTLLVPAQRITYNKAAGAEAKERTLKSYVLGHYKSERGDNGLSARAVALRDHNSYSVLLAHFYNEGFDQHVTLAQVFWVKETQGQPARFYVVSDHSLTIAEHFANFGADINTLKKRLRQTSHIEVYDSFPPYGAAFRRRFGINSEQALELFNQTVSMKSVGNLTDFVREHMLEAFPVANRIEALVSHFDDLNHAHEAVLKAKAQVEVLEPLVADNARHGKLSAQVTELCGCREALRPWFALLKSELLDKRLAKLAQQLIRLVQQIQTLDEQKRARLAQRDELKQAISDNGGDRIERVKAEIATRQQEKTDRGKRAERYNALADALDLPEPTNADTFLSNQQALQNQHRDAETRQADAQNALTETTVELRDVKQQHETITRELTSLRQRRSNIPSHMLVIRDRLREALTLDEQALPFAGELIQVRETERDWEGAAERLLHSFGLSLLVPDAHYAQVAEWVDRTHLKGRLVYYRVREPKDANVVQLHPDSLVRKLAIKPDSEFYPWLESELTRRFNYACCESLTQFRREKKAITHAGQIKAGGERHEKDDRHRLDDRSRYVLGWSNKAKIAALEKQAADLATRAQAIADQVATRQAELSTLNQRLTDLDKLAVFSEFRELDWRPLALDIERLEQEKRQLEAESDILRTLEAQLQALEQSLAAGETDQDNARREHAKCEEKHERAAEQLDAARSLLEATPEDAKQKYFPQLDTMRNEALGDHTLSIESCDNRQTDMREWLQNKISNEEKKINRLAEKIIRAMQAYCQAYPLETREVDVSVAAAGEYLSMLQALKNDDLPRFEARFKSLLNENTIREVANFQAQLNRERQTIRERIETINRSLTDIDYNPRRYITLLAEPATDKDIREFQQDLRACTEGALTGSEDEQYSESKFIQVKRIIEQFRGREGYSDLDRRWTRKVTDVRNWFSFSASERWCEDHSEYEHYSDSGGKSGGQKEKLAYTVLAASLAYQFGLEWGEVRSRSFRFVVIDEAFGRGSDESARYGLELFKRLNLQLLIVTPLQKIHIIEPYVNSVGFVHNEAGAHSLLRNLSIEEYRAEQARRRATPAGPDSPQDNTSPASDPALEPS